MKVIYIINLCTNLVGYVGVNLMECGVNKPLNMMINFEFRLDVQFKKDSTICLIMAFYFCVCLALGTGAPCFID
jgi:hypothetical protein